jgi:hypothetical protein
MLHLELRPNSIYLTTDDRADMLRAVDFLMKEHREMEELGKKQRTIYVTKEPKEVKVP